MINEFRKLVEKNASTFKTSQRTDTQGRITELSRPGFSIKN